MRPGVTTGAAALLMAAWAGAAVAADPPTRAEVARATKPAVAVVRADPTMVSATCVSPNGYFLSFAGGALAPDAAVTVVLQAGEKGEKSLPGKVVDVDHATRLALVKVDSPTPLAAVEFGDETKLTETDELLAFVPPNPLHRVPAPGKPPVVEFSPVGVNKVKVTTLAKKEGTLTAVVVTPRPDGVDGGPVTDLTGKAVGLLAGDVKDFTTAAVIPANVVRAFLARPRIAFDVPPVEPARRHDPAKVAVTVFALPELADADAVELVVRSGGRERRVPMTRGKAGYEASVAPFEKAERAAPVAVELRFPEGAVRGEVPDRPFTVGGKSFTLGQVSGVRFGKAGGASLPDGTTADGEPKGLEELPVAVGGQTLPLPTAAARELTVRRVVEPDGGYRLIAVVRRGGKEAGRAESLRFLKGMEPHGIDGLRAGLFTKPPAADKPTTYTAVAGTDGAGNLAGKSLRFDAPRMGLDSPAVLKQSQVTVRLADKDFERGDPPPPTKPPVPTARFDPLPPRGDHTVVFAVQFGQKLQAKEYPAGGAEVKVTSDNQPFRSKTARLVVWELEADEKGVKAFAADAVVTGETGDVYVSVRFNSKYK